MPENKKPEISDEDVLVEEEEEFPLEGEIEETSNFDELYDLLTQKGKIAGSKQKYATEYLIGVIDNFRNAFKKFVEVVIKEELTEDNIENLLKVHSELMADLRKITRREKLRLKVLEFAIREARKSSK